MNRIVTVSREFGSGGRELAEKLAEKLGFKYYNKSIITDIAKQTDYSEDYVKNKMEKSVTAYPAHFGRASFYSPIIEKGAIGVMVAQRDVIKKIASDGDCVIVGRGADVILAEFEPFNVFVYADESSRIARCRSVYEEEFKGLSDKEVLKKLNRVDKERAACRAMFTDSKWGDRNAYNLMLNTSGMSIDTLAEMTAKCVTEYYDEK